MSPHLRRNAKSHCGVSRRSEPMAFAVLPRAFRRFRGFALVVSAILHAIALGSLAQNIPKPLQAHAAAPPMHVTLVRPFGAAASREFMTSATADHQSPIPGRLSPSRLGPEEQVWVEGEQVGPSAERPDGRKALAARTLQALGKLRRCDREELSREERERCEAQMWAGVSPPAERPDLDPTGRFAVNSEPFLSRRPEEGCRLRITGDQDTMGDPGHTRGGFTCVGKF